MRNLKLAILAGIVALAAAFASLPAFGQAPDVGSAQLQRMPKIGAYPPNSSVLQATSGTVAAATATATLTSSAGNTAWIFGFDVNGGGATAASIVDCTITGLIGATAHYSLPVPAGATAALPALSIRFPEPIPASATNTNIVVSCPSLGAGNTAATVNAYGFLATATSP